MNRLRAFRAIEGINQTELGELMGMSAQMVSAIENGTRSFTERSLAPLGYDESRLRLAAMSEPLHRQKASTTVAAGDRAKELLRLAGEVFVSLRERTPKVPPVQLDRVLPPESLDDCEDRAVEVRYMLRHEERGPIQNLTAAVERAGVCIVPMTGMKGIDGLSAWVEDVPVIGVAPDVPGDRLRLTLAHEIMHLVAHTKKTSMTESEANRFAAALLFPRSDFDCAMPDHPQLRDFVGLKKSWGVSVAALVYRAHELEHIDDRRYRALQIQMSKWRRNEPGHFDPMRGELFPRLVEINGGVRSVAANAGVNASHLAALTNWSHLRIA